MRESVDGNLILDAALTDPDGADPMQVMKTSLVDYGPDGTSSPQAVLTTNDQAGWSDSIRTPGTAVIRYPFSNLTDGHLYGWTGVSTDGAATSAPGAECRFWLDETSPQTPTDVSDNFTPAKPVGQMVKITVKATDVVPTTGRASGMDHFQWGIDDSGQVATRIVPHFSGTTATVTIRFTPNAFGEHSLYVVAVDAAGNRSTELTVMFYTYDPNG